MIMSRGWWRRRRVASLPANDAASTVVLDFYSIVLETVCEHGTYIVDRVAPDWAARFRPKDACPDSRYVAIDARDEEGNSIDWPTRGCAEDACRLHAHLLELGHSVVRATELVAQRSQRVSQHQRVDTVEYAQPVRA